MRTTATAAAGSRPSATRRGTGGAAVGGELDARPSGCSVCYAGYHGARLIAAPRLGPPGVILPAEYASGGGHLGLDLRVRTPCAVLAATKPMPISFADEELLSLGFWGRRREWTENI